MASLRTASKGRFRGKQRRPLPHGLRPKQRNSRKVTQVTASETDATHPRASSSGSSIHARATHVLREQPRVRVVFELDVARGRVVVARDDHLQCACVMRIRFELGRLDDTDGLHVPDSVRARGAAVHTHEATIAATLYSFIHPSIGVRLKVT